MRKMAKFSVISTYFNFGVFSKRQGSYSIDYIYRVLIISVFALYGNVSSSKATFR